MTSTAPAGYPQRVHRFARSVSRRLLLWSGLSMIAGAALWWRGNAFWRAFGIQAVVWGAIDALIAAAGLVGGRRQAEQPLPDEILLVQGPGAYRPAVAPGAYGSAPAPAAAETLLPTGEGKRAAPGEDTAAVEAAAVEAAAVEAAAVDAAARSARRLSRLLWLNTLLDVGYIAGGAWLVRTKGRTDPAWRGHGWGVIVQGAFLFVFDLTHALRVPKKEPHP
jgi:hypothetical protein